MKKLIFSILLLFLSLSAFSQYYGRNKIKYETFHFHRVFTKHFVFYTYLKDTTTQRILAEIGEKWYARHRKIFKDTIPFKNPVIVYNNHADFQQNTVSNQIVDVGTGGFTEGNQNRIVMPLGISWARTDHVLGHELVHAFQYATIEQDTSLSIRNVMNIPLWMIEGMAEYLSLGSIDENTAMWIRDAVATNKFPTFKDLFKPRYFPYRWGQAFWAFIDGVYGPDIFIPLYKETARVGYARAFKRILGVNQDTLAKVWKRTVFSYYKPLMKNRNIAPVGHLLIGRKKGGKMNVSPTVSPNGKYIAFLTEHDIFTLDMWLADAKTGKLIRKLHIRANDGHIDAADVYESTGSWSPDSKRIAFVVYEKGNNALLIVNVLTGKIEREIFIPGLDAFTNPAWSPDGKNIIVSALRNSQTDLVMYNLKTNKVKFLTNDIYAQFQASWSPDGKYLVFSTDSFPGLKSPTRNFRFAIMNMKTHKINVINIFPQANNLNPVFSADGSKIYFLSDADGFRDLYVYDLKTKSVKRLTNFFTGISGITMLSPAMCVDYSTKSIIYSFYYDNTYSIYSVPIDSLKQYPAQTPTSVPIAMKLPPVENTKHIIDKNIAHDRVLFASLPKNIKLTFKPYKRIFKIEALSNVGFGVGANSYMGMGVAGGINVLIGDVLGDNRMYFGFNGGGGGFETLAGQFAYLNQQHRTWWGVSLSHQPYQLGYIAYIPEKIYFHGDSVPVINAQMDITTIFNDNLTLFATYPITQTQRIETSLSGNLFSFLHMVYNNYYNGAFLIAYNKQKLPSPPSYAIGNAGIAYIEDDSYFGMTSPLKGKITSVMLNTYFGVLRFNSLDLDFRRYIWLKPVSFAFRFLFSDRFGKDAESPALPDFYLAYPWYVRGYTDKTLTDYASQNPSDTSFIFSLTGSKLLVTNFEIRLPLTGISQLALIPSRYLFSDFNVFFDAGLAWHSYDKIALENPTYNELIHTPLLSTGVSLRINVFGQMIIEPYAAYPISLKGYKGLSFGINLMSGW